MLNLFNRIAKLETRMDSVEQTQKDILFELKNISNQILELKGDIKEVRGDLKGDIKEVRGDLKGDIKEIRAEVKTRKEVLEEQNLDRKEIIKIIVPALTGAGGVALLQMLFHFHF